MEHDIFENLNPEQNRFLLAFLRHRGNLKGVQNELGISYIVAKDKLDNLLFQLHLTTDEVNRSKKEKAAMISLKFDRSNPKASEIIKAKLLENDGHVTVYTARGLPCEIWADSDGKSFVSDKLPIKPNYEYAVFDVIVELLVANGGRAKKGNGRNYKLGHPNCDEHTVVGAVAKNYAGKKVGDSVFDPVFVLAAVLEWAGIVHNGRGELVLTQYFGNKL
mgnify:CR=1 FL=1